MIIETLGGNYENMLHKLPPIENDENETNNSNTKLHQRKSVSPQDSALEESSENMSQTTEQCNPIEIIEDEEDDFETTEDSDSYITMSDASFTTESEQGGDEESEDIIEEGMSIKPSNCCGTNPLFKHHAETSHRLLKSDEEGGHPVRKIESQYNSVVKSERHTVVKQADEETVYTSSGRNYQNHKASEEYPIISIGDPEKCIPKGQIHTNVFRQSLKHIKARKNTAYPSNLLRSKSEGNIHELIMKEEKPSLFKSIKRFVSRGNKSKDSVGSSRGYDFYQSTPCLASMENEFEIDRCKRSRTMCEDDDVHSLPLFFKSKGEALHQQTTLFSCFNSGTRPIMPNHKNVQRPRDVKYKSQRRLQNAPYLI